MKSLQDVKWAQGLTQVSVYLEDSICVFEDTASRTANDDGRQDVERRTAGRQAGRQAYGHRITGLWKNGKKSGRGFENVTPTPEKKSAFGCGRARAWRGGI